MPDLPGDPAWSRRSPEWLAVEIAEQLQAAGELPLKTLATSIGVAADDPAFVQALSGLHAENLLSLRSARRIGRSRRVARLRSDAPQSAEALRWELAGRVEDPAAGVLLRARVIADYAGAAAFAHGRRHIFYSRLHLGLGILAISFAAAAGVTGLAEADPLLVGIAGAGAAVSSGLQTFLRPDRRGWEEQSAWDRYQSLQDDINHFLAVERARLNALEREAAIGDFRRRCDELDRTTSLH